MANGKNRNIILFGESGSGKSSIINLIAGCDVAETSSGVTGCTFEHKSYNLQIHGRTYEVFDTTGLEEGEMGTVKGKDAITQLYKLIVGLDGGVNLLLFCMRGRIKKATHHNWNLFNEIICKNNVPIVLVVTGMENEENTPVWWRDNKAMFEAQGIRPKGRALITAIRGRALQDGTHVFDEQYEESRVTIMNLIANEALIDAWRVKKIPWFYEVAKSFLYLFRWIIKCEAKEIQDIADTCGMSKDEARDFARQLADC